MPTMLEKPTHLQARTLAALFENLATEDENTPPSREELPDEPLRALKTCLSDAGIICSESTDLYDAPGFLFSSPNFAEAVVSASLPERQKLVVYAHFAAHIVLGHIPNGFNLHIEYLDGWEPEAVKVDPVHVEQEAKARSVVEGMLTSGVGQKCVLGTLLREAVIGAISQGLTVNRLRELLSILRTPAESTDNALAKAKAKWGYALAAWQGKEEGYLIKPASSQSDEIYVIENGRLRRVIDFRVLHSRGKSRQQVRVIGDAEFEGLKLRMGTPLRFARLIQCAGSEDRYVLQDGHKRHIPSLEIFEALGLSEWDVIPLEPEDFYAIPTGEPILPEQADNLPELHLDPNSAHLV